jgi:excinuclease ABC subunit B
MERAMDETRRRRERQEAHNKKHGIKPESIVKKVTDIMESAYPDPRTEKRMVGEDNVPYDVLSPEQLMKKAAKLEKQMLKAARDLEFEEAARLRDEVQRMRDFSLGVVDQKGG